MKRIRENKKMVMNIGSLHYFNIDKQTFLHVDAGLTGLGAVLSQEDSGKTWVIAFGSWALIPTEQKYSQIEREMSAITWSLHFHIYLMGNRFILYVRVVQKPIISSLETPRTSPSSRIERLILKTQMYDWHTISEWENKPIKLPT